VETSIFYSGCSRTVTVKVSSECVTDRPYLHIERHIGVFTTCARFECLSKKDMSDNPYQYKTENVIICVRYVLIIS